MVSSIYKTQTHGRWHLDPRLVSRVLIYFHGLSHVCGLSVRFEQQVQEECSMAPDDTLLFWCETAPARCERVQRKLIFE